MDRFIEFCIILINFLDLYLKSNMDRFIGLYCGRQGAGKTIFKIQYG